MKESHAIQTLEITLLHSSPLQVVFLLPNKDLKIQSVIRTLPISHTRKVTEPP